MAQVRLRSALATLGLVVLSIASLIAVDIFLARLERAETKAQARSFFREAQQFINEKHYAEAIDRLEDALLIDRDNRGYSDALAESQFASGKLDDAQRTLNGLLESDSTDGLANLLLARVLLQKKEVSAAISHYHRAIYGEWPSDAARSRTEARFELIDVLSRENNNEQLMAELLPVQDQASRDPQVAHRLGTLFLRAGSPGRAATMFRELVKKNPSDAAAYRSLGEAELAMSNYRSARSDFASALRLNPDDAVAKNKMDLCDDVLALDPTLRGLPESRREERSAQLLALAQQRLVSCSSEHLDPDSEELVRRAEELQKRTARGRSYEQRLDLAEQIAGAISRRCAASPIRDALTLVLARLQS